MKGEGEARSKERGGGEGVDFDVTKGRDSEADPSIQRQICFVLHFSAFQMQRSKKRKKNTVAELTNTVSPHHVLR